MVAKQTGATAGAALVPAACRNHFIVVMEEGHFATVNLAMGAIWRLLGSNNRSINPAWALVLSKALATTAASTLCAPALGPIATLVS